MVLDETYRFTTDDPYKYPQEASTHETFVDFFKKMPNITLPSVFGFHANADITKDIGESNLLFDTLLLCSGSGGGESGGSKMDELLSSIV
jgi:dynein heavy chain